MFLNLMYLAVAGLRRGGSGAAVRRHGAARERPEQVLAVVAGAVLLQALLYPGEAEIRFGLFRTGPLRLPELLLGAALLARVLVRGAPTRLSAAAMAWTSFFLWYSRRRSRGVPQGQRRSR